MKSQKYAASLLELQSSITLITEDRAGFVGSLAAQKRTRAKVAAQAEKKFRKYLRELEDQFDSVKSLYTCVE